MGAVSEVLIWFLADIFGIKEIRKERSGIMKVVKLASWLLISVITLVLYFMIFGYSA